MGSKSSPPPPPDPVATADAQSKYDKNTAAFNAALNRYNVYTPLGSQTWKQTGTDSSGAPIWAQSISLAPNAQHALDQQQANQSHMADLSSQLLGNVGSAYANPMSTQGMPQIQSSVSGYGPLTYYGAQQSPLTHGVQSGDIQSSVPGVGPLATSANGGNITRDINTDGNFQYSRGASMNLAGLPALPTANQDYAKQVSDSLYSQQQQYLDPQWQQQKIAFDAQMANQGVLPGTQAYDAAYKNFSNAQQQAYSDARNSAISGGVNAMNTLFGMGLGAYNAKEHALYDQASVGNQAAQIQNQAASQQFENALNRGQFQNAAQAQAYGQSMGNAQLNNAAQGQQFGQNLAAGQFGNQAQQQQFQQGAANAQLNNQAAGQEFAQNMGNSQFYNQAQQQAFSQAVQQAQLGNSAAAQWLQQQMALYNQPLNTYNALATGSQVSMPTFQSTPSVMANAPNYIGAANNAYQGALNAYQTQQGAANSLTSGLFSLGSAALGAPTGTFAPLMSALGIGSDVRIKQDIVKVADHPAGFGLYSFEYQPHYAQRYGAGRKLGVLAQEVAHIAPEAVGADPHDGHLMVDYAALARRFS